MRVRASNCALCLRLLRGLYADSANGVGEVGEVGGVFKVDITVVRRRVSRE